MLFKPISWVGSSGSRADECLVNRIPTPATVRKDMTVAVFLALLLFQAYLAASYRVPVVGGYKEVTTFISQVAPD